MGGPPLSRAAAATDNRGEVVTWLIFTGEQRRGTVKKICTKKLTRSFSCIHTCTKFCLEIKVWKNHSQVCKTQWTKWWTKDENVLLTEDTKVTKTNLTVGNLNCNCKCTFLHDHQLSKNSNANLFKTLVLSFISADQQKRRGSTSFFSWKTYNTSVVHRTNIKVENDGLFTSVSLRQFKESSEKTFWIFHHA